MIKFFRKIRKNLLTEGKTGKYFKYAIGEIILVVIGILIALQINNWNLTQQDKKTEKENLQALQKEFSQNRATLQEVIQVNNDNISGAEKMIQSFSIESKHSIKEQTMAIYASETFGTETNFEPGTGVLTEIISSGQLKLIQNIDLKHKLAGFNSRIDKIEQQEKEVNDYRIMAIKQMILEGNMERAYADLGLRKGYINSTFKNRGNKAMLNSLPFLNQIVIYQSSSNATNRNFYDPLYKEIEIILELIANRLKEL